MEAEKNNNGNLASVEQEKKDAGHEAVAGQVEIVKNCNGPNSEYSKLVSSDGQEFTVKREHALVSGTITSMLSGPDMYEENETNVVTLREISGAVLEVVVRYFDVKAEYTNSETELEEFEIKDDILQDVLLAANFLDC